MKNLRVTDDGRLIRPSRQKALGLCSNTGWFLPLSDAGLATHVSRQNLGAVKVANDNIGKRGVRERESVSNRQPHLRDLIAKLSQSVKHTDDTSRHLWIIFLEHGSVCGPISIPQMAFCRLRTRKWSARANLTLRVRNVCVGCQAPSTAKQTRHRINESAIGQCARRVGRM